MWRKGRQIMSKIKGLLEWFKTCPEIEDITEIDVSQLAPEDPAAGLYKQPTITVQKLIDGSEIRTETYYLLFLRPMNLRTERVDNEEYLETVEDWIWAQELAENYPDIGYPVHSIDMSNAFYMLSRPEDSAASHFTAPIK